MSVRKRKLKLTYKNVEPMYYNGIVYIDNDARINYSERNKDRSELEEALKLFGITIPDTIDAHSVEWILNELYLKMNRIELLDFMDHLESNSTKIFGKMTKGE